MFLMTKCHALVVLTWTLSLARCFTLLMIEQWVIIIKGDEHTELGPLSSFIKENGNPSYSSCPTLPS